MDYLERSDYPRIRLRMIIYTAAVFSLGMARLFLSTLNGSFEPLQEYLYFLWPLIGMCSFGAIKNNLSENNPIIKDAIDSDELGEILKSCLMVGKCSFVILLALVPVSAALALPFDAHREAAQVVNLLGVCTFFFLGSYYREVSSLYRSTTEVPEKQKSKLFAEEHLFFFLGWLSFFAFMWKSVLLPGKQGIIWNQVPEIFLSKYILYLSLTSYVIGSLGCVVKEFANNKDNTLNNIFLACLTFGTGGSLVCLYPIFHSFFFSEISVWTVQLLLFVMSFIVSIAVFLSFQADLYSRIIGKACLTLFSALGQILLFLFLWKSSLIFSEMSVLVSLIYYGILFIAANLFYILKPEITSVLIALIVGVIPFAPSIIEGDFVETSKSQWEISRRIEKNTRLSKELAGFDPGV